MPGKLEWLGKFETREVRVITSFLSSDTLDFFFFLIKKQPDQCSLP